MIKGDCHLGRVIVPNPRISLKEKTKRQKAEMTEDFLRFSRQFFLMEFDFLKFNMTTATEETAGR